MMARRHRLRAARNLIAAGVLLVFFWWCCDCPMPTREMELHHHEREYLIDQSSVVLTIESEEEGRLGDPVMLVGVSKRTVQTSSRTHRFNVWPRNPDGATLVVLPSELQYRPTLIAGLAAVEPPALAERAKLTMDMAHYTNDGVQTICTIEGERRDGVFLFRLAEDWDPDHPLALMTIFHTTDLPPYTLEFFDKDGNLLETVTNIDDLGERS